jgi:predicted Zn-dependent protease
MLTRPLTRAWKRCVPGRMAWICLVSGVLLVLIPSISVAALRQSSVSDLEDLRVRTQTKAMEIRVGSRAARRFEREIEIAKDVALQEYVDSIAKNLASHPDVTVPVTIKVVDATEVNAVSFPGGFLYISSGLILAVDDEAEIAGVLAHEIAHVVARDGLRNDADPIVILSPKGAGPNVFEGYRTTLLTPPRSLREIDADRRAMQYMQTAGYDPKSLLVFLEKMQAEETIEQWEPPAIFQTHPDTAERIRLVQERISAGFIIENPRNRPTDALREIKARLAQRETNRSRPE